jgi:hypothetical protein
VESDSNATDERDVHFEKQNLQRSSTEAGIQIDVSDEHSENADSSIRRREDFDSNVTVESEWH